MQNYFEFLPSELIIEIFSYINDYKNVKSFGLTLDDIINKSYFESLFHIKYSKMYSDIKEVIDDDIYLSSTPNGWLELYAIFKENYKILTKEDLAEYEKEEIKFEVDYVFKLQNGMDNPMIIYRALFNKYFKEIYEDIKKLETFNFDTFDKYNYKRGYDITLYGNFGFFWDLLARIYFNAYNNEEGEYENILEYERGMDDSSIIDSLFEVILNQKNYLEILKIISSDSVIHNFIQNNLSMENVKSMIEADDYHELFKFIYKNDLSPTEDYGWEYLIEAISYDKYDLFKWLLENGEKSWLDNLEFDDSLAETYQHFKILDYNKYKKILNEYRELYAKDDRKDTNLEENE